MLIFNEFCSVQDAEKFAAYVRAEFCKEAVVCSSQNESDTIDPFPHELTPPIVLVERGTPRAERAIEECVIPFRGSFAGT